MIAERPQTREMSEPQIQPGRALHRTRGEMHVGRWDKDASASAVDELEISSKRPADLARGRIIHGYPK
jgi:hypothetical protein